jgi:hypothetical protein
VDDGSLRLLREQIPCSEEGCPRTKLMAYYSLLNASLDGYYYRKSKTLSHLFTYNMPERAAYHARQAVYGLSKPGKRADASVYAMWNLQIEKLSEFLLKA